jgi:hypothetical protein
MEEAEEEEEKVVVVALPLATISEKGQEERYI